MGRKTLIGAALLAVAVNLVPAPAQATTLYVFTDPMTFERRAVVIDPKGPDRTYLCTMPPSQAGCQLVKRTRG
jgi:hypothetical protein